MMRDEQIFELPPQSLNENGDVRTVGFEIEFGGIDARRAADIVQAAFGGGINEQGPFAFSVEGTALGDFEVKLDTRFLSKESPGNGPFETIGNNLVQLAGQLASLLVPQEIVAPPIPLDRLHELQRLVPMLRRAGASGTEQSVLFAFGLHINPEAPSLAAEDITAVLKAFALLRPYLWRSINPDPTRRLIGFAQPFEASYVVTLLQADYWPALPRLIDDYLAANPTRNRDLDLLPLFAYLDETRVRAKLPDEKIGRRPTYHYRLPDARVSDQGWSLATEWNRWVLVERLAQDRDRLSFACRSYQQYGENQERWARLAPTLVPA